MIITFILILIWFVLIFTSLSMLSPLLTILPVIFIAIVSFSLRNRSISAYDSKLSLIALSKYIFWLLCEMFKSSLQVIRIIWAYDYKIKSEAKDISLNSKNKLCNFIYANSITLTPGTITVNVDEDVFLVHALEKNNIKDLESLFMENKIKRLFR